jgi:hypothetical protein
MDRGITLEVEHTEDSCSSLIQAHPCPHFPSGVDRRPIPTTPGPIRRRPYDRDEASCKLTTHYVVLHDDNTLCLQDKSTTSLSFSGCVDLRLLHWMDRRGKKREAS